MDLVYILSEKKGMDSYESMGSFYEENKKLLKSYLETRFEIFKLQAVKIFSQAAGYFLWSVISVFLIFLVIIFGGITLGFWLSSLTGSFATGFGIVTAAILVLILILAIFRHSLFIDPIVRKIISNSSHMNADADIEI